MKAIQFQKKKPPASNLHINVDIPVHKLPICTFNILTTLYLHFVFYTYVSSHMFCFSYVRNEISVSWIFRGAFAATSFLYLS